MFVIWILEAIRKSKMCRRSLRTLRAMSDRDLEDIGLSRRDLEF